MGKRSKLEKTLIGAFSVFALWSGLEMIALGRLMGYRIDSTYHRVSALCYTTKGNNYQTESITIMIKEKESDNPSTELLFKAGALWGRAQTYFELSNEEMAKSKGFNEKAEKLEKIMDKYGPIHNAVTLGKKVKSIF